jgi:hypothetical protein
VHCQAAYFLPKEESVMRAVAFFFHFNLFTQGTTGPLKLHQADYHLVPVELYEDTTGSKWVIKASCYKVRTAHHLTQQLFERFYCEDFERLKIDDDKVPVGALSRSGEGLHDLFPDDAEAIDAEYKRLLEELKAEPLPFLKKAQLMISEFDPTGKADLNAMRNGDVMDFAMAAYIQAAHIMLEQIRCAVYGSEADEANEADERAKRMAEQEAERDGVPFVAGETPVHKRPEGAAPEGMTWSWLKGEWISASKKRKLDEKALSD